MHITLIGMSNIGKSHWSQRLADAGFERIACDGLIEEKLAPELVRHGYAGIRDVARWMGQPYDSQYTETSGKYMACERAVMLEIIQKLKSPGAGKPRVIDTTGSVIYTGKDVTDRLRALTGVIYFEASAVHMEQLFDRYIKNPKPVIWGNIYAPASGENPADALKRCYPELLRQRAAHYKEIAHMTIPYEKHRAADFQLGRLLAEKALV